MTQLYDPSEGFRGGLNTLAQSFIAGMQAKQQKEQADREAEFRQQQALAEADRQERIAKVQEAQQQLALLSFGQKAFQEGTAGPGLEGFVRSQLPSELTTTPVQRPVSEILPPSELPIARPPQAPVSDEQKQALQQLQVISDRLNMLPTLAMPEETRTALQSRLEQERERAKNIAFGQPSQIRGLETRPRGESFVGARPLPIRPAGAIEERKPISELFKAPPEKPLKPSEDPLVQTQKEVELNFRSGRMSPGEMEKYYRLKSEYGRTGDKNAFLQGIQGLKFRERPEPATTGASEQRARYNLLLGYQDAVHATELDNDRIEDNQRAKDKEITDIKEKITALDQALARQVINPQQYNQQKSQLDRDLNKSNNEIRALDDKKVKNLERAAKITASINKLEREVGLPGEFETKQAEEETIKVDY